MIATNQLTTQLLAGAKGALLLAVLGGLCAATSLAGAAAAGWSGPAPRLDVTVASRLQADYSSGPALALPALSPEVITEARRDAGVAARDLAAPSAFTSLLRPADGAAAATPDAAAGVTPPVALAAPVDEQHGATPPRAPAVSTNTAAHGWTAASDPNTNTPPAPVKDTLGTLGGTVGNTVAPVVDAVRPLTGTVAPVLDPVVNSVAPVVTPILEPVLDPVRGTVQEVVEPLGLSGTLDSVGELLAPSEPAPAQPAAPEAPELPILPDLPLVGGLFG
jgi:hypothetical protein